MTRKEMWSAVDFEELKLKEEKKGDKKKKVNDPAELFLTFYLFVLAL